MRLAACSDDEENHRNLVTEIKEAIFCILFVGACTKRMASGGTRPAGVQVSKMI